MNRDYEKNLKVQREARELHLRLAQTLNEVDLFLRGAGDAGVAGYQVEELQRLMAQLNSQREPTELETALMTFTYRLIVGEVGNECGHTIEVEGDEKDARRALRRELAKYGTDGWGRIEYSSDGEQWERLQC